MRRFWSKVNKTKDCWLWTGAISQNGYGKFQLTRGVQVYAHRLAYELTIGEIPIGLQIDHLCRVRNCVNPMHLEAVTAKVNTNRSMVGVFEKSKTHCPQGHEYSVENTYFVKVTGWRKCRTCNKESKRRRLIRGDK